MPEIAQHLPFLRLFYEYDDGIKKDALWVQKTELPPTPEQIFDRIDATVGTYTRPSGKKFIGAMTNDGYALFEKSCFNSAEDFEELATKLTKQIAFLRKRISLEAAMREKFVPNPETPNEDLLTIEFVSRENGISVYTHIQSDLLREDTFNEDLLRANADATRIYEEELVFKLCRDSTGHPKQNATGLQYWVAYRLKQEGSLEEVLAGIGAQS